MATAPYNLEIVDNCMTCSRKGAGFFCDLAAPSLKSLEEVKYTSSYPSDALLFVEGQAPRGVYILCKGRVKLTMTSADGKSIILHIAGPGELIGLDAALSGAPYGLSAETLEPCQVNFVKREAFMRLMQEQPQSRPMRRSSCGITARLAARFGHWASPKRHRKRSRDFCWTRRATPSRAPSLCESICPLPMRKLPRSWASPAKPSPEHSPTSRRNR